MEDHRRSVDHGTGRRRRSTTPRQQSINVAQTHVRTSPKCAGRKLCILSVFLSIFVAIGAGFGAGYLMYANVFSNNQVDEVDDLPLADMEIQTDNSSDFINLETSETVRESKRIGIDSPQCGKLGKERFRRYSEETFYRGKRIVGGSSASLNNFPWQVSLWTKNRHTCGGSIISSNWILTAAHCTEPYPAPENWTVYAGATFLSEMEEVANLTKLLSVTDVVSHPEFDRTTYDNDVALMRMEYHLTMNDHICPICLPDSEEVITAGEECLISGWGALSEGGKMPNRLQEATVRIIDLAVCNADTWLMGLVSKLQICAGTEDGSMDACQGDSGGPLSCTRQPDNQFYLPGLVSWGIGCGEPRMPGVYTDLRFYRSWIIQSVQSVELRYE